jgi:hypothetical protein
MAVPRATAILASQVTGHNPVMGATHPVEDMVVATAAVMVVATDNLLVEVAAWELVELLLSVLVVVYLVVRFWRVR